MSELPMLCPMCVARDVPAPLARLDELEELIRQLAYGPHEPEKMEPEPEGEPFSWAECQQNWQQPRGSSLAEGPNRR
jgi:hypothetical protein